MAITTGAAILGGAVIGGAATAHSASKSAKAANNATAAAKQASDEQAQVAREQLDFAKQQWQTYTTRILPLELEASKLGISAQKLAQQRGQDDYSLFKNYYLPLQQDFVQEARDGIQPEYDRVSRDAAATVDSSFERSADMQRRELERRGVRPDSGQYQGIDRAAGLTQAATRAHAVNLAREGEKARVEDTNFNRMAVALGRQPMASSPSQNVNPAGLTPSAISGMMGSAGSAFGNVAQNQTAMAGMHANAAGSTMQGGINLGAQALQLYNQFKTPAVQTPMASAPASSWGGGGSSFGMGAMGGNTGAAAFQPASDWGYQPTYTFANGGPVTLNRGHTGGSPALPQRYADGGPVTLRRGYAEGGQVNGPPGIDQVPAAIEGPQGETYDARLTDGEYVIPIDVVMAKGTDFFDKLIQKHHKPVKWGGR